MEDLETRVMPKGTMVKIGGIPLFLEQDTPLTTHKNNWSIALEDEGSEPEAKEE